MHRWRGLSIQLFVLTILPLTLLMLVIAFGSLFLHQRTMRQLVGERDERATRAAASAISEQLKHRQSAVRGLALRATESSSVGHLISDAAYLVNDFDQGIAIYDANFNLLATSNDTPSWELMAAPEILRQLALNSAGVEFSDLFIDPVTRREGVLAATSSANGLIVVGVFSPVRLADEALSNILDPNSQVSAILTDASGKLLFQTRELHEAGADLSDHPGVREALSGISGTVYGTEGDDGKVIAFSPISPLNWALVVQEPWRAVADPLLRATEWAPLVLVPILIIALIGLFFGLRQIVQPLQSLERKAANLGSGDFEGIEQSVGGINEIQRLQSELIQMAQKVKLAQQSLRGYLGAVTAGQEEERRRLARDLHDDTIQSLIALNQRVQLAQLSSTSETTTAQLAEMQAMTEQTISDLRRVTSGLRPIYLEDLGLVTALSMLARDSGLALGIPVALRVSGPEQRLPPEVELALYRIAQEGLNNVTRHAQATCADLKLIFGPASVTLVISDDGRGFIVPENPALMTSNGHFGLLGIRERAENIGARVLIESNTAEGTRLTIALPLVAAYDSG
jgi:signal transduction histidine kinase